MGKKNNIILKNDLIEMEQVLNDEKDEEDKDN
jgi:hypothetical protein